MGNSGFRTLFARVPVPAREDVRKFFATFAVCLVVTGTYWTFFAPGRGESSYDSGSIRNFETVSTGSAKVPEIFVLENVEPKESAPPEPSEAGSSILAPEQKRQAAPSRLSFSFRPDPSKSDDRTVSILRANLLSKFFVSKVLPLSVTVDSERREPRGQVVGRELILSDLIGTESEKTKVFVHELGHIVDIHSLRSGALGDPSEKFYAISWDSYKVKKKGAKLADFVSGYALSNKYEDFAESFSFYVFHNAEFKRRAATNAALWKKYRFFSKEVFGDAGFASTDFSTGSLKGYVWDTTKPPIDTKKYLFYIK